MTVTVANPDDLNNLSNFEYTRIALSSNTNQNPVNAITLNFPDTPTATLTVNPTDSPELISYLKGTELIYTVYGKGRRITTKPMTITLSVTVTVK